LHPPDGGIAWLRATPEVIHDVLSMVGPHRNLPILASLRLAAALLADDRGDDRNHVGVPAQMLGFIERPGNIRAVPLHIAQMQEMNFWPKPLDDPRQVIIGPRAQRPGA